MKKTIKIKGQRGFGDSICLYPIINYLSKNIEVITYTDFPEVYRDLNIKTEKYDNHKEINAGYLNLKNNQKTTQYEDICKTIGLDCSKIPFVINNNKKKEKICLFRKIYTPLSGMKKKLEAASFLMPKKESYYKLIDKIKPYYKCFQFGNENDNKFDNIENINLKKDFNELVSLIGRASLVVTQVGHTLHLSEALGVKTHVIFSKKGLSCSNQFVKTITPKKVLFTKYSSWEID